MRATLVSSESLRTTPTSARAQYAPKTTNVRRYRNFERKNRPFGEPLICRASQPCLPLNLSVRQTQGVREQGYDVPESLPLRAHEAPLGAVRARVSAS